MGKAGASLAYAAWSEHACCTQTLNLMNCIIKFKNKFKTLLTPSNGLLLESTDSNGSLARRKIARLPCAPRAAEGRRVGASGRGRGGAGLQASGCMWGLAASKKPRAEGDGEAGLGPAQHSVHTIRIEGLDCGDAPAGVQACPHTSARPASCSQAQSRPLQRAIVGCTSPRLDLGSCVNI